MSISFIVPAKNEEETVGTLFDWISATISLLQVEYEVIFIDDGSTDRTWEEMLRLKALHPERIRAIRFRRNLGKAAALTIGYRSARGSIIFTMDADLQDDPMEVPRFLRKLDEGYDLVSGWKKRRYDPWHKVLPSRVFNKMLSWASGVHLHDHNCGFKCYRAEVADTLTLYGEMHRMVPALAGMYGFRVGEIPVQHHPRQHGTSKYGIKRFFRGFTDMCTVAFLAVYRNRPLHLMAGVAAVTLTAAVVSVALGSFVFEGSAAGTLLNTLGTAGMASVPPVVALGFVSELLTYRNRAKLEEGLIQADLAPGNLVNPAESESETLYTSPAELQESA